MVLGGGVGGRLCHLHRTRSCWTHGQGWVGACARGVGGEVQKAIHPAPVPAKYRTKQT